MVVDDVSVALHPVTVQAGNLFPNPSFEEGDQLDNPKAALPAGIWARGGSDGTIDQVSTARSVTASHSLAVVDNNENGYGEWYGFLTLPGIVAGDALELQWFQLYSVTNGSMRLTFAFTDANNSQLAGHDFNVTDQSPGWLGTIAASPFEKQNQRLVVPDGTVKLRVNLASGGSSSVTGLLLVDDLSVRIAKPDITGFAIDPEGFKLTWDGVPGRTYAVQFSANLSSWTSIASSVPADGASTSYVDKLVHAGTYGFYRVVRE